MAAQGWGKWSGQRAIRSGSSGSGVGTLGWHESTTPLNRVLPTQVGDGQSPSTMNYLIHLQERPVKQTISR